MSGLAQVKASISMPDTACGPDAQDAIPMPETACGPDAHAPNRMPDCSSLDIISYVFNSSILASLMSVGAQSLHSEVSCLTLLALTVSCFGDTISMLNLTRLSYGILGKDLQRSESTDDSNIF